MTADLAWRAPLVAAPLAGAAAVGLAASHDPVLTVIVLAFAALGVALVAWPEFAVLVVVFLFYVNAPGVAVKFHSVPLTVAALVPLLLIVPLSYRLYRGERLVVNRTFLLLLLLLGVQVLATAMSREPALAWEKVKTFMIEGVLLYFLVLNTVRRPDVLRRTIWALLLGAAILGSLSLYQEVSGNYARPFGGFAQVPREFFTGQAASARLAGPLGDPNYYAQMLLIVVPLGLLSLWGERSGLVRLLALGSTVLAAVGVTLTFSRGAGVAFLVVLVLMVVLRYLRLSRAVAVAVGVLLLLNLMPAYKERVATLTTVGSATAETAPDVSVRSRATEMLAAALVFADHPVLGVGPAVFPLYYQEYANKVGLEVRETVLFGARRGEEARRESHNMFLSVAADLGIFGLIVFIAIIVSTLADLASVRGNVRNQPSQLRNATNAFGLAIAAYVTSGIFLTLAFERYFWLLLALGGAAAAVARSSRPVDEQPATAG